MTSDNEAKNSFSLRPKARILKTLGEELISSETVALIELIKNSYDADAKNVLVEFTGEIKKGKGCIIVSDDGHGMNLNVVQQSWMTIATSNKKYKTSSQSGKRRVLGEKGIGRFATSRISSELELSSRINASETEIYTLFDWSQFEDDELYLDEVLFLTEERKPEDIIEDSSIRKLPTSNLQEQLTGTLLKMSKLKHTWESKDYKELERGLSRLISPFSPINDFNIYLKKGEHGHLTLNRIEPPEIIKYPHYMVKGKVGFDGQFEYVISVEALGESIPKNGHFYRKNIKGEWLIEPLESAADLEKNQEYRAIECGAFEFELRIWDRDDLGNVEQKIGAGIRSIQSDLNAIAGVNIYRDGFRVLPYGEPNNDWLRLDLRRVQTPTKRISNNQITGYIAITADGNPHLHDRSNREGLDNNSSYNDLKQIVTLVLSEFESIRYVSRRPKTTKGQGQQDNEQGGLFDEPDFSAVKDSVQKGKSDSGETLQLLSKVEADWKKQITNLQNVLSQYHSLATLGGIVDKVLHDGRQPLAAIQVEAGLGKEQAEDWAVECELIKPNQLKQLEVGFEKIVNQASVLSDVFRRVEPFGGRKKGRPKKYYIEDLIKSTFDIYERDLKAESISFELPNTQTLVSTDVTEISEIFTNLITNSIYWLGRVPKDKRAIHVTLDRLNDGGLEIVFADTGPGVDPILKDRIFEPYVGSRPGGHGLGLCLVGEIVKGYYNGTVELLDSNSSVGAVFRLVMRKRV
ncbi:MAG: nitrogen-specific signal transduction histidine kinase [Psychromonas sp.]|jgi:nitrogen-specific signal transduction histidine kinase|uniref:sensor histidine kinase n=1 Tax=Psychromonas sp. TaxID=1884585 RepID=UPI0039E4AA14